MPGLSAAAREQPREQRLPRVGSVSVSRPLLAAQTQTIVVTHNRGTVETADTLYGVSMGADGVSKTLSLQLSEVPTD